MFRVEPWDPPKDPVSSGLQEKPGPSCLPDAPVQKRMSVTHVCKVASVGSDCDPMDRSPPGSSVLGILQARRLTGVGCHFLQGICPTLGSNMDQTRVLVSCVGRQVLYLLHHPANYCFLPCSPVDELSFSCLSFN